MWYELIYSICVGSFFSGLVLSILLFISAASNLGNDSGESAEGSEVDADLEVEGEIDVDADIDGGESALETEEFSGLADVSVSLDAGNIDDFVRYKTQTPISLIFSLYLLWFGAIGLLLFDFLAQKILWLILILVLPIGMVKLIDIIWVRVAVNTQYRIRSGLELIGRQAIVKIAVSTEGGLVSIKNTDHIQQLAVKAQHGLAFYYPGDKVFVTAFKNGIYYVDSHTDALEYH